MGMIIMNGKEYTSSPKDGFPPIIYSDEEREIGVWRDGRPLYEKTIYCGDFTGSGNKEIAHNISNLGRVVKMFGAFNEGATRFPLPIVMWGSAVTYQTRLAVNDTNIIISRDTAAQSVNIYVTLQYTKTTDTPGSGKYTTYGGLTHHYSTTEQVVGTWIDGKPIYECSWEFSPMLSVPPVSWTNTSITVASKNFKKIVGCEAVSGDGDIWGCISAGCTNGAVTYVQLMSSRQQYNVSIEKLTLRYTKTTD